MKKLFAIVVLSLFWGGPAYAKIDWQKRNLCEDTKYKSLCSKIVNKKLFGLNTIANFKFEKGIIISLIKVKKGENISLLNNPDPSYVAKYTGEYIVYKNVEGEFITEFKPSKPMEHLICDKSDKCLNAKTIK